MDSQQVIPKDSSHRASVVMKSLLTEPTPCLDSKGKDHMPVDFDLDLRHRPEK